MPNWKKLEEEAKARQKQRKKSMDDMLERFEKGQFGEHVGSSRKKKIVRKAAQTLANDKAPPSVRSAAARTMNRARRRPADPFFSEEAMVKVAAVRKPNRFFSEEAMGEAEESMPATFSQTPARVKMPTTRSSRPVPISSRRKSKAARTLGRDVASAPVMSRAAHVLASDEDPVHRAVRAGAAAYAANPGKYATPPRGQGKKMQRLARHRAKRHLVHALQRKTVEEVIEGAPGPKKQRAARKFGPQTEKAHNAQGARLKAWAASARAKGKIAQANRIEKWSNVFLK